MFDALKRQPTVARLLQQFEALPDRDQLMLKILAVALGLILLYAAMWVPAKSYMNEAQSAKESAEDLLALVQQSAPVLKASNRSASGPAALDSQQLVASVTNLARRHGVALKRFEPSGDSDLKVWIDDVAFDKVVDWLASLRSNLGVEVEQISLDAGESSGLVGARLTLRSS